MTHRKTANSAGDISSRPLPDIKPQTPIATLDRSKHRGSAQLLHLEQVAPAVGMSVSFIRKVLGTSGNQVTPDQVITLLDQDAFGETYLRRSQVLDHLMAAAERDSETGGEAALPAGDPVQLLLGDAQAMLGTFRPRSIDCVVTSTPYWGMRVYKSSHFVEWADGEVCPYGHEQTPEGFLRHTAQLLAALKPAVAADGSVWWNVMDSYNTRTQIRGNAAEALRAMQGLDQRAWADHESRRYSAGHVYAKDGEQVLIPGRIAERASRLGYYVKSVITWAKPYTTPEPQKSRVSRSLEYVLHLSKQRTPKFNREAYRQLPPSLGGRNTLLETDKLSDVWHLATSSGIGGHGAQFPLSLPARCIGLSTNVGDVVLDPFVGSGNTGVAARSLGRKFVGIDVSPEYLTQAEESIGMVGESAFGSFEREQVKLVQAEQHGTNVL